MLVANFKSHKNTRDCLLWLKTVGQAIAAFDEKEVYLDEEIVVCPQYPSLEPIRAAINSTAWQNKIKLGAQDISAFDEGAYTGEVAATTLGQTIDYCIIGHSERRRLLSESS